MKDEKPNNVVGIRPNMRGPAELSPIEALVYIGWIVQTLSYPSGERAIDLTLDATRTIIAWVLKQDFGADGDGDGGEQ